MSILPPKHTVDNVGELLRQRFGVKTTPRVNDQLSTVGTSAVRMVKQSPARVAINVVNLSVNNVWCGPFVDVASTKGIRLGSNGGNLVVLPDEDFNLVSDEWFIVADVAASAVLVLELLIIRQRDALDDAR